MMKAIPGEHLLSADAGILLHDKYMSVHSGASHHPGTDQMNAGIF
jgi:hypothetical protein